jgi:hypothetical protein
MMGDAILELASVEVSLSFAAIYQDIDFDLIEDS